MSQELRVLIIEDDPDVRLGCEQAMMLADLPVEGEKAQVQLNVQGVPEGYNIGPGILGHCANDNPWIALPLYAVLLALFLRLLDELLIVHPNNPFVVLPVGAAIGQLLGLARGETATFLFHACTAIAIGCAIASVSNARPVWLTSSRVEAGTTTCPARPPSRWKPTVW